MKPIIIAPNGLGESDHLYLKDNEFVSFYYSNNKDLTISLEESDGLFVVEKTENNEPSLQLTFESLEEAQKVFDDLLPKD